MAPLSATIEAMVLLALQQHNIAPTITNKLMSIFLDLTHLYATNTTTFIQQSPIAYMLITSIYIYIYTTRFTPHPSVSHIASLERLMKKKIRENSLLFFFGILLHRWCILDNNNLDILYIIACLLVHIKQRKNRQRILFIF